MFKKTFFTLAASFIFFLLAGCQNRVAVSGKIRVAASFYPLAEFAMQVGGEHINVINITPGGTEPHDYEPTPKEIGALYEAKIFIFNGAGLDPWAEKIQPELEKRGVKVIKMSDHFNLIGPHFWLDPVFAQKQVELISDALVETDPANAQTYKKNSAGYIQKLAALDQRYQRELQLCQIKESIVSHDAFGYLAARYNLRFLAIAGATPEDDPSLSHIGDLIKFAKEKKIKFIFFETLANPKLTETIAREVGAQTLVLNPLEGLSGEELAAGKNYLSVMEENLTNLRRAHDCPAQ